MEEENLPGVNVPGGGGGMYQGKMTRGKITGGDLPGGWEMPGGKYSRITCLYTHLIYVLLFV